VGTIGREGMSGMAVVMGNGDRVPHETSMQIAGNGLCLSAGELKHKGQHRPASRPLGLWAFIHDADYSTALANGRSKIEERLARWLLLAHDRVDGDELPLTHEFLAVMLGVRRSGVTIVLQEFEHKGLIAHRRSIITMADRKGLEQNSNGRYPPPNGGSWPERCSARSRGDAAARFVLKTARPFVGPN
jgi:Crp-like helix-turn-helix domain